MRPEMRWHTRRMPEGNVRQALRSDLVAIAELWTDAFADDPYLRWMGGDAEWARFGHAWMTFIASLAFERGYVHVGVENDVDVAVAWIPPGLALAGPDDIARGRSIIAEHAGEARADAALQSIAAARAHDLEEPHWTLQYAGVRPSRAGSGVGSAAVRPILDRCDAEGLPCALISTNPRNVPFYERLGFRSVAEVPTPDDAAVLRPMRRPPAG